MQNLPKIISFSGETNRRLKTVDSIVVIIVVTVTVNESNIIKITLKLFIHRRLFVIATNFFQRKCFCLDKEINLKIHKRLAANNKLNQMKLRISSFCSTTNNKNILKFSLLQTFSLKFNKIIIYFQTSTGDIQKAITRVNFFQHFFVITSYKKNKKLHTTATRRIKKLYTRTTIYTKIY